MTKNKLRQKLGDSDSDIIPIEEPAHDSTEPAKDIFTISKRQLKKITAMRESIKEAQLFVDSKDFGDRKKIVRAIAKKLRDIGGLLTRQEEGKVLDEQQQIKLAGLDDILADLAKFRDGDFITEATSTKQTIAHFEEDGGSSEAVPSPEKPNAMKSKKVKVKEESCQLLSNITEVNKENRALVSGIPYTAVSDDVYSFFQTCGEITDIYLPTKPGTDKPRGLAFIKFATKESLDQAITMNGACWPGTQRWVKVIIAEERSNKSADVSIKNRPKDCDTIFVGNLAADVTELALQDHFSSIGTISEIRLPRHEDGLLKGFCHLRFEKAEDTVTAIKKEGTLLCGRAIRVDYVKPKKTVGSKTRGGSGQKNR